MPVYRRTTAGRNAWDTQNSNIALEYRRVLGLITGETDSDKVREKLSQYSQAEMLELLGELEQQGLLESFQPAPEKDLDFTANLKLSDLKEAQKSKHKPDDELDFTSELRLADVIAAGKPK